MKSLVFVLILFVLSGGCSAIPGKGQSMQPEFVPVNNKRINSRKSATVLKTKEIDNFESAVRKIALSIASGLHSDIKSVALLNPVDSSMMPNKGFEMRLTDGITNYLKPMLPRDCRFVERSKLKTIFIDFESYGDENRVNTLLEESGVDVNILGSYTYLRSKDIIEISYRALALKNGDILATSPLIYLPGSVMRETRGGIMLIVRGLRLIGTDGGKELINKISGTIGQELTKKGMQILSGRDKGDDPFYEAQKQGARVLVLIELDGKKEYTKMGFIKGVLKMHTSVYRIPKKEIIFENREEQETTSVSESDNPLLKSADFLLKRIKDDLVKNISFFKGNKELGRK